VIKNIRPFVQNLVLDPASKTIKLIVSYVHEGSARPADIITYVLGFDSAKACRIKVVKTKTLLA